MSCRCRVGDKGASGGALPRQVRFSQLPTEIRACELRQDFERAAAPAEHDADAENGFPPVGRHALAEGLLIALRHGGEEIVRREVLLVATGLAGIPVDRAAAGSDDVSRGMLQRAVSTTFSARPIHLDCCRQQGRTTA